jgi:D-alanine-D-alanine ligase
VLVQAEAISASLRELGHAVESLACGLDLKAVAAALDEQRPELVFNLAEGLAGQDRLYPVIPLLLESLRVPYTGCSAEATFLTTQKLLAKERLAGAGVPTAEVPCRWPEVGAAPPPAFVPGRYIVKPVWEHGSVGMTDDAVFAAARPEQVASRVRALAERTGRAWFAERYVDGREINLSLLAAPGGGLDVLPAAEIDFSAYPAGKPRILGYAAKWDETSFEYHASPRTFEQRDEDAALLAHVAKVGRRCWELFGLAGYARVDFRVDATGVPYVLEVNTNPCLSPDAGFAAAVDRAGLTYRDAIDRIAQAALAPVLAEAAR